MNRTSLGDRMKKYECVSKNFLMRRQPAIIRIDGKAFHTFTRGFNRPFDDILIKTMQETMKYLCENIQGCVLGYTQSDEITLVLCDYQTLDTDAWFSYNIQKMTSIAASMATMKFNQFFTKEVQNFCLVVNECGQDIAKKDLEAYKNSLKRAVLNGALFDARAFTVPINDVTNCLLWRQQDATRNSIQSLAQSLYSHKELHGINTKTLQDKMLIEKNVNWNDLSTTKKRGSCCIKIIVQNSDIDKKNENNLKNIWVIDNEIPIFSQNREYIESRIMF